MNVNSEMAQILIWHGDCLIIGMFKKLARLFQIRTRFEAAAVVYTLAVGAVERGSHYLVQYPGKMGWVFFIVCTTGVFMAGGVIFDSVRKQPATPGKRISRTSDRPSLRPRSRLGQIHASDRPYSRPRRQWRHRP